MGPSGDSFVAEVKKGIGLHKLKPELPVHWRIQAAENPHGPRGRRRRRKRGVHGSENMGQGSERREDKGKHQKPAVDGGRETKKIEDEAEVKEEEGRRQPGCLEPLQSRLIY